MVTMLFLTGCLGTGGGIGSNQNPQSVVTLTDGTNVVNVGDTVQLDGSQSWELGVGFSSPFKHSLSY